MKARILLVEDEPSMRRALTDILESEGYRVQTAADGEAGVEQAVEQQPDVLLLDVMLPKLDGFALCAELRRLQIATPVLMLTAKGQVQDRVMGLDSGADDYLVKPFSTEELLARVRALLRRQTGTRRSIGTLVQGDVQVDLVKLTAFRGGGSLRLTAKEFAVLRLLAEAAGEPVTRQRFLDLVWGYAAFPTTRTVDNHIASLRAKLETAADSKAWAESKPRAESKPWIDTVHGVGYRLASAVILQNRDSSAKTMPQNAEEGDSQ